MDSEAPTTAPQNENSVPESAEAKIESEENLLESEAVVVDRSLPAQQPPSQQPPQQQPPVPQQEVSQLIQSAPQSSYSEMEESTYVFFKSSDIAVDPKIKDFLNKQMEGNPFNKYCIDCKKKKTSHFLVQFGLFVCQDCANIHSQMNFYQQSRLQIKHVYFEHWDDYQLKSVQVGGNRPLFDLLKEYEISDLDIPLKYRHAALRWFRRHHLAKCDGQAMEFTENKPAKNMDEQLKNTKAMLKKEIDQLNPKIKELEDKSVDFSLKVDKKLQEFGTKISTSKFGMSVTKQFNKITKRDTNNRRASMEGESAATNLGAFAGQGTAVGSSSTGETGPAFEDPSSMAAIRESSDSSIAVPVVHDENKEEPKGDEDKI